MAKLTNLKPMLGRAPSRVRPMPKIAASFYTSPEWRKLSAAVKRERGGSCERCGSKDRVIADHIVELKDGGAALDRGNLELLCHACHQTKTAKARAARAAGLT